MPPVIRGHKLITFANGQSVAEVLKAEGSEYLVLSFCIDGANFGDGMTAWADVYFDLSGYSTTAPPTPPPLGNRICSGAFGGYVPLAWRGKAPIHKGESVYISLENTTGAGVDAMVEWEIVRLKDDQ